LQRVRWTTPVERLELRECNTVVSRVSEKIEVVSSELERRFIKGCVLVHVSYIVHCLGIFPGLVPSSPYMAEKSQVDIVRSYYDYSYSNLVRPALIPVLKKKKKKKQNKTKGFFESLLRSSIRTRPTGILLCDTTPTR
jgi:hypothetical protein